jgi:hypothetical protein
MAHNGKRARFADALWLVGKGLREAQQPLKLADGPIEKDGDWMEKCHGANLFE